jgi:hypothetical protein
MARIGKHFSESFKVHKGVRREIRMHRPPGLSDCPPELIWQFLGKSRGNGTQYREFKNSVINNARILLQMRRDVDQYMKAPKVLKPICHAIPTSVIQLA